MSVESPVKIGVHLLVAFSIFYACPSLLAQNGLTVSGCMVTACHGSHDKSTSLSRQAGAIWFDQDPHARAYTSLLSMQSQRIVNVLTREKLAPNSERYVAFLEKYCVSCHATDTHPSSQRNLGVDCQSCHGPLSEFDERHYSEDWKKLGKMRFARSQCVDLESPVSRAKVCSSCHIGQADRSGQARIVDHQIMAAGHPPMHFDVQIFLSKYPKHWMEKNTGLPNGFAAFQKWQTNKLVMAKTRIDLLCSRSQTASQLNASRPAFLADWPEFTEYSCSSCHHELTHRQWRPSAGASALGHFDDWYLPYSELGLPENERSEWNHLLSDLRSSMEQLQPDATVVYQQARSLSQFLERNLAASDWNLTEPAMTERLKKLCSQPIEGITFESAVQWVSVTDAMMQSLGLQNRESDEALRTMFPFLANKQESWKPNHPSLYSRAEQYSLDPILRRRDYLLNQLKSKP